MAVAFPAHRQPPRAFRASRHETPVALLTVPLALLRHPLPVRQILFLATARLLEYIDIGSHPVLRD